MRPRRKGVGLIVVLAVLALLGGAMIALMAQSGTIAYQTQRMDRQARIEDLQASGAAWARLNRAAGAGSAPGRSGAKTLDVTALGVPGGLLSVETLGAEAIGANAGGTPVRITCQCGADNRSTQATMEFVIP